jgi:tRNA (cytidine/uridine-2'-O-)-methyltransferase
MPLPFVWSDPPQGRSRGDNGGMGTPSHWSAGAGAVAASLHVVLVSPEIHWNTGNAGRTCLAAGAKLHLVRPLGFSLDDRSLRRAGLDYWDEVDPVVWPSWATLEQSLPALGEPYLLSADGDTELWDVAFADRAVLIFGRESVGLPHEIRAVYPKRLVRIPMLSSGAVRSLNLSTAVAVALFEVLRQRREGQWAGRRRQGE